MPEKKEKLLKIIVRRIFIFIKFLFSGLKLFLSSHFLKNKIIFNLITLSFILNLFLWIMFLQNKKEGDYPVILHYNLIFGVDYLDQYQKIYLISAMGLIILLFNLALGYYLYLKEKLASYLLVFSAFIVQIFLLFAGYLIIAINS
ncbi:hypothetical protein KAK05_02270 [Candidatus Parcubacteria bacterium]|nr:hypothetical protein [Candidatus Parcubacteria bacterium]